MALFRIVMRLARNPGAQFSEADDHRGYTLVAPLTPQGRLDEEAYRSHRNDCSVRRFAPDEEPQLGRLLRHGQRWVFDYGALAEAEEPVFRLGDHRFATGEYVSITDEDGELLTYKVTEVSQVAPASV